MFSFIFKLAFYFFVSFVILSFPTGNETLFSKAHTLFKPLTTKIINEVTQYYQTNIAQHKYMKKLFDNAPSTLHRNDIQLNAKNLIHKDLEQNLDDDYTVEEKEMLIKILKK